jgi:hypothetical protein
MKSKTITILPIGNSLTSHSSLACHAAPLAKTFGVALAKADHCSLITIMLALCCFALSPTAQALLPSQPPDGGYPNGNTAEGTGALFSLTTGTNNTALGFQSLYHDTTGSNNAATGFRALYINTSGVNNTATGSQALSSNTTGNQNTANGYVALSRNTSGGSNTATGSGALHSNTSASHNTATGYIALYNNTTGGFNTATGDRALHSNTTGTGNTAAGYQALDLNTTAYYNTATGFQALYSNTTGGSNVANGESALYHNTAGSGNTANGEEALYSNTIGVGNVAIGQAALEHNTTGEGNIAVGVGAGGNLTTGNDNIDIGNQIAPAGETGTIRIGQAALATFISGISGVTVSGGTAVYVKSDGQLGTNTSSLRFKQDIQDMGAVSKALLALRPVTFRYKPELDRKGIAQFGLVAEEVEKVNPDLVVRDAEGKPYSVRYEAVNAMLLNEFLKEHRAFLKEQRKVQEQGATIAQLKKDFQATVAQHEKKLEAVTARLEEQAAQIQKVSAQLEVSSPRRASQVVANNQ